MADTSAMGGVMIPIMKREGYSAAYAVNVTTHASLSGALMPTSHNMIIYAFAAQAATGMIGDNAVHGVSIGDLMFAGTDPVLLDHGLHAGGGALAGRALRIPEICGWQVTDPWVSRLGNGPEDIPRIPAGLLVVGIILGCVMKGIATPTEAAAVAVTYSLVLTAFIYRTMTREKLVKSLAKASRTTGVVLLLIGVSNMLRYQMAYLEIPDAIEQALLTATTTPWLMLLCINVIQVFLGVFLDMAAHILITTPLSFPSRSRWA